MECTEIYARAGTCRASTYGTEKRSRALDREDERRVEALPATRPGSKCVSIKSLPTAAVQ